MHNVNDLFFTKCICEDGSISQSAVNVTIQIVKAIALLTNTTCLVIVFGIPWKKKKLFCLVEN